MRTPRFVLKVVAACAAGGCLTPGAGALVMQDGVTGYEALADQSPFSATGGVYRNGSFTSSGVLVADNIVLGASHDPVSASTGTFRIGGQTYDIVATQRLDADFDLTDGRDFAIYTLSEAVADVAPAPLYQGDVADVVGMLAYYTGLGDRGTGSNPPTNIASDPDELLLVGTNVIDQAGGTFNFSDGTTQTYADNVLFADFDDGPGGTRNQLGGGDNPTALEVGLASGDSGGGLFIFNDAASRYELVGLHGVVIGSGFGYGQILGSTALSGQDRQTITALIPEPGSALVLLAAGGLLLGRRRVG